MPITYLAWQNQPTCWTRSQFHQHFTCAFFVQNFGAKKQWSWLLGLKYWHQKYCTKNTRVKRWWNWHLVQQILRLTNPTSKQNLYYWERGRVSTCINRVKIPIGLFYRLQLRTPVLFPQRQREAAEQLLNENDPNKEEKVEVEEM